MRDPPGPQTLAARILDALPWRDLYFVFPSAVAAQFRLRQAALESGLPAAADRFLAWDDFKARTLSRRQPGKRPAGTADRMIFAGSLFRENAAARGGPFLKDIISPPWADAWEAFVPALVRLLPGLHPVIGRLNGSGGAAGDDPYMEDLRLVEKRYETWLEERRLYEAAWNRGSFDGGGLRWVLFFPELAADWDEYREELEHIAGSGPETGASLVIVPLEDIPPPAAREDPAAGAAAGVLKNREGRYIHFRNSADEYRWVSLTVKKLFDAGLAPEDMAISFPGIENAGPLIRELERRDIEAVLHEGKPLPDHSGGRIFASLAACPASRWSFRALKNLLLDKAYPWKHREAIDAFIEFGVRFRCISGLSEKGRDMWERSFRRLGGWNLPFAVPVPEIEAYYGHLKRDIQGLVQAKSFAALREQWYIFEGRHFDRSRINGKTNSIIARALIALDELVEAAGGGEQENAYGIFQAYLGEKKYVRQPQRRGIPLYDYKVAAGIEPVVHFVLNMNQRDISVRNRSFLREDRRDLLGIREQDLSAAFIRAYGFSALFPVFTVSGRTAEGPAVPHRMLRETAEEMDAKLLDAPEDPWAAEEALAGGAGDGTPWTAPTVMQRKGWEGVTILRAPPRGGDLRFGALADPSLRAVLDRRLTAAGQGPEEKDGKERGRRLSPTDLNEYLCCPFMWMLVRGLGVQERQTMIETIDQRELGMLYHKILERFFNEIAGDEKVYRQGRLGEYVEAVAAETDRALEEARSREGAFQESVYGMLRKRINAALYAWLEKDSPALDGCEVLGGEYPLRKEYAEEGLALSGKADLVLKRSGGADTGAGGAGTAAGDSYVLTDFKTAVIPSKGDLLCDPVTGEPPRNVQMAAYIAMLEAGRAAGNRVGTARFYSLDLRKYRKVLDEEAEDGGGLPVSRDAYQREVDAVDLVLRRAAGSLESGTYAVPARKDRRCQKCPVSSVCRANYTGGEA
ncbi:MAG: PD-(D/E)XK nuclease family protein [Treponema sp.]|jgi:CRISPR/Cas system-associated exonuclease Cas4 (RecB family)|nr:PD-(D/E)XK nuclease family protein [Treponema sp.]